MDTCSDKECRRRARDGTEQVSTLGDTCLSRQHAPKDGTIQDADRQCRAQRDRRAIHEATRHEKAEPAEDQPRRTDMDRGASQQPDEAAAEADHHGVHGQQGPRGRGHQQPTYYQQRRSIGHEVPEASVQEGHRDDAIQPTDVPGDQAEDQVQAIADYPVDDVDHPEQRHKGRKRRGAPKERAHVTPFPHVGDSRGLDSAFNDVRILHRWPSAVFINKAHGKEGGDQTFASMSLKQFDRIRLTKVITQIYSHWCSKVAL